MNEIYPWQQQQWQLLAARCKNKSLPHAIVLSGCAGLGKLQFAQIFATFLLCEKPSDFACGNCRSCLWLKANVHPDLFIVRPEEDSTAIKVEQIRQLTDELSKTSSQAGYQIIILEPAEAMNTAAANAILKTLEEPQGQIIFILVSHQPSILPATIRSRCQSVTFAIPKKSVVESWLQQNCNHTTNVSLLLSLSENIPLLALSLAQDDVLKQQTALTDSFYALSDQKIDAIAMAKVCLELDSLKALNLLISLVMDIARIKLSAATDMLKYQQNDNHIRKIAPTISMSALMQFIDKLLAMKKSILAKSNINLQLAFEGLFVDWSLKINESIKL